MPEPAAFLIDSLKQAAQPENFQLVRPTEPWISPSDLYAGNYMYWAKQYGVTGSVTPPPEEFLQTVAHTDVQEISKVIQARGGSWYAAYFGAFSIKVPDNYKAVSGYVQRTSHNYTTDIPLPAD